MVSPGLASALNTPWLAWLPELRLHVGEAAAEQLLGAVDGELLGDVDVLAAAVVALARDSLRRTCWSARVPAASSTALRDDVLRGDQLDLVLLAAELLADGGGDLGIGLGDAWR